MKWAAATSLIYSELWRGVHIILFCFFSLPLMEHALHFQYKLKSYSLIFPAAQLCPSELINEICHHAKPLCLTTFPKTPRLPPSRSPMLTHLQPYTHRHTHTSKNPHTARVYTIERWDFHKQPHKCSYVYNVVYKEFLFFLILLSPGSTNKH